MEGARPGFITTDNGVYHKEEMPLAEPGRPPRNEEVVE